MRFNLVGAMGAAIQLSALAFLANCLRVRYLWASATAIEFALLHNFVWHMRYTWRDRSGNSWLRQLVRFQLSNGLVSLVGNVVIMRILVSEGHVPIIVANCVVIACCSVLNFRAGNRWAFMPIS